MKKIFIIIVFNLIIGNTIAWLMGAGPIDFPVKKYTSQTQAVINELKQELVEFPEDVELLIQLGEIYMAHNQLDLAQSYLEKALEKEPGNALALAVVSANRAKQSGAMIDLTMGIYKIYSLWNACDGLNQAVDLAPDSFEVRTYRMASFAAIGEINRYFDNVFLDEAWFKKLMSEQGEAFPFGLKQQFYLSMATAYINAGGEQDLQQARAYFKIFEQGNFIPELQIEEVNKVKQQLTELSS